MSPFQGSDDHSQMLFIYKNSNPSGLFGKPFECFNRKILIKGNLGSGFIFKIKLMLLLVRSVSNRVAIRPLIFCRTKAKYWPEDNAQ